MKQDATHGLLIDITLAVAMAVALAACGDHSDDSAAARKADAPTARAGLGTRDTKDDTAAAARARPDESTAASRDGSRDASTSTMGAAADARDKVYSPASGEPKVDDSKLTSMVLTGLKADKELNPLRIDVDTRDGVVTLSGSVPTAAAKARASEIAKNVKDVKSVNNQLTLAAG